MLEILKTVLPSPEQWEIIIEGMRNPLNSWDKSDSGKCCDHCINPHGNGLCPVEDCSDFVIGDNDLDLMERLAAGGSVHAKYRRMIPVFLTVNAPLYWWKEFDTYRVGVCPNPADIEMNSCSTMHKIHSKEFIMDDFSHEHLDKYGVGCMDMVMQNLNSNRDYFLETGEKTYWHNMIQLLPDSYNQRRTLMLNYEVLANIYRWRKDHKLDEWHTFCDWIRSLPYSELITGGIDDGGERQRV